MPLRVYFKSADLHLKEITSGVPMYVVIATRSPRIYLYIYLLAQRSDQLRAFGCKPLSQSYIISWLS